MTELLGQKAADAADDHAIVAGSMDLVSKLERLASLRQSGELTEMEFEQAKRALLKAAETT